MLSNGAPGSDFGKNYRRLQANERTLKFLCRNCKGILPVTWTYRTFFAFLQAPGTFLARTQNKRPSHICNKEKFIKLDPGRSSSVAAEDLNSRSWTLEVESQKLNLSSRTSEVQKNLRSQWIVARFCAPPCTVGNWPVPLSYLKTTSAKRCLDIFEQKSACFSCVLVCDRISRRCVWYAARSTASADVPAQLAV